MPGRERKRGKKVNGEGSIYQRASDGLWLGSAYVYTASGRIERKYVSAKSFDDVKDKLLRLQSNNEQGIPVPDRSMTVAEYMEHWLSIVKVERRLTTYHGYESVVRLHIVPILGKKRLDRLMGADVRQFINTVRGKCLCCTNGRHARRKPKQPACCRPGLPCCERRPTPRQVQYVHAVLRNALGNAEREELVMRNVAKLVKVPTPKYKVGKGLTVRQAKTLLEAAKGTRWYALYVTAATLGLRHGELLGLRWQDIDFERATLTVAQTVARAAGELYIGPAKSDASESTIPLPKVTRRVLEEHRRHQDDERTSASRWEDHDLVFPSTIGTPREPRNLNRHFAELRERVGMPDVRLHDLRHTVVSLLLDLGTPPHVVQAIARHAHIDVTMAIYAHTNLDAMRQALDAIEWEDL
ncbi:site-specific integrase [Actinomycetospora chlora]|uniref:Site-specific integrase n=1 Tax=Actinomycetospora chlora TaxID=663608 RepID=A0ABP9A6V3_9PSEU